MDNKVLNNLFEKTHELISAPTCSAKTKAVAQSWLKSVETDMKRKRQENIFKNLN